MERTTAPLILFLVSLLACPSRPQCLQGSDVQTNETSVGDAVRAMIDGSVRFSLDLFRTLNADSRSDQDSAGIFFSPHSIWSALMVAYMGARGPTELEMRHVLGVGDADKATTWGAFRNIRNFDVDEPNLALEPPADSFTSANRIYFQEGTAFKDCVRELLGDDIAFVDFEQQAEAARQAINGWVEAQTQQRIADLLPAGAVSPLTRMVIANAVYFKEAWQQQFDPKRTARRRFTTSSRKDIFVSMMTNKGKYLYGKSEELNCYALEMPYAGNTLSMVVLLPRNRYFGVDNLANNLTPDRLMDLMLDLYPREVQVSIPKFKVEDSFELSSVLQRMGLRTLFDPRRVDLSGFTGSRDFKVDAVHHKTFIDVNEEGTEAAAATAIILSRSARPVGPAAFIADYPFVYFIKDNLSNVILFMGTVQKPPEFEDS